MGIRPLHDIVLIARADAEDTSAGGLIIPDNAKERPLRGRVVAIGMGVTDVKPGNEVLIEKWVGTEIDAEGECVLALREGEILAVFEEEAAP